MCVKSTFSCGSVGASRMLAFVRPLTGMGSHMYIKGTFFCGNVCASRMLAFVKFFSSMGLYVNTQFAALCCRIFAVRAFVRSLTGMASHVYNEITVSFSNIRTVLTVENTWRFFCADTRTLWCCL